ncbi:MAG: hypothetical protein CR217_18925 [Beijerinckiaceae bacterium]|nr:MAG: hypothetical protein CR217_18925 [Beijerinckiaceae bacterium]
MISSFEVRTYSTTTLGKAQGCQLFGPNQEPKARSDYVLAQPSTLHASRRPVSLRSSLSTAGAMHGRLVRFEVAEQRGLIWIG